MKVRWVKHWAASCLLLCFEASAEPSATDATVQHRTEVTKRPPTVELKDIGRVWSVERSAEVGARLIELVGPIPLHFHPDSTERVFVIEGELEAVVGERRERLKPGDYIQMGKRIRHRVAPAPGYRKVLIGTVDLPPADPARTVWLEPQPVPIRGPN